MLVSVCMIVRNEEQNLERALQSIPESYEKIVVDTGSTDASIEIARRNGAVVSSFEWIQDFAAARNYSVSIAKGKYILVLDADELLAEDTEQQIEAFVRIYPDRAGTVNIENRIKDEWHTHRMVRFFPNDRKYVFEGAVHEKPHFDGEVAPFESTGVTVVHYGYQEELYSDGKKTSQYLDLYQKHLEKNPEDGYMLYQLAKLYYSIGEKKLALDTLERCLAVDEQNNLYYPVMLVMLGYVLKDLGHSRLAEELLTPFTYQYNDFPDLFFLMGLLAMDTGKIQDVESYFIKALQIGETRKFSSVKGVGTFKASYNLGVYYEVTNKKEQALKYYKQAAQDQYGPAVERLQNLTKSL
ncbi:glycosyltransferase [Paenibacillus sp. P26]|nr:glycosyltransferase [Paenibacillus sp. P26]